MKKLYTKYTIFAFLTFFIFLGSKVLGNNIVDDDHNHDIHDYEELTKAFDNPMFQSLNQIQLEYETGQSVYDEIEDLKAKIEQSQKKQAEYKNKIQSLKTEQGQINNEIELLQNEIFLLDEEIEGKKLILQELEKEITSLEKEIEELKIQIDVNEKEVEKLEVETDKRILNMYLSQKQGSTTSSMIFSAEGPSSFVKSDTYRQALQQDTNDKLEALDMLREQLEKDKEKTEENKYKVDQSRNQTEEEKIALDRKRNEIDGQRSLYWKKIGEIEGQVIDFQNLDKLLNEEQKKLRDQYDQLLASLSSKNEKVSGAPIKKGEFLGREGDTGYAYGVHLHWGVLINKVFQNPCSYLPSGAYGCGTGGSLGKPMSGVLTSGYRTSSRPNHYAIDLASRQSGGGMVVAAHDGYAYFAVEACPKWAPVCNHGGAIYARVCENDKCETGLQTIYLHLRCTAEPSSSPRSCS